MGVLLNLCRDRKRIESTMLNGLQSHDPIVSFIFFVYLQYKTDYYHKLWVKLYSFKINFTQTMTLELMELCATCSDSTPNWYWYKHYFIQYLLQSIFWCHYFVLTISSLACVSLNTNRSNVNCLVRSTGVRLSKIDPKNTWWK